MTEKQIFVIHGTDYKNMALRLMEKSELAGEWTDKSMKIGIKPNLVLAAPASEGATTHPELVAGVIEYFQKHGFLNLVVLEGAWLGARTGEALRATGVDKVCREYGVPFVDLQKDKSETVDAAGMRLSVCREVLSLDYLVNLPVVKGHCQTVMTCALKNLKGVIPNSEKRRFHTMGLHKPIGHLVRAMPPMFCLADNICGDLDFEEGGNPVVMNRIFCCKDPVLCDAFACQTMGYDAEEVDYIGIAQRLGAGSADLAQAEVLFLNQPAAEKPQQMTRKVKRLAEYTEAREACSACYGALIHALDRLDQNRGLRAKKHPVAIGQGYRGKTGTIGIGSCCGKFDHVLMGCPPDSRQILEFLEAFWDR